MYVDYEADKEAGGKEGVADGGQVRSAQYIHQDTNLQKSAQCFCLVRLQEIKRWGLHCRL